MDNYITLKKLPKNVDLVKEEFVSYVKKEE